MLSGALPLGWQRSFYKAALVFLAGPALFMTFAYLLKIVLGLPLLLLFPSPDTALGVNLFTSSSSLAVAIFLCFRAWPRR